MGGMYEAGDKFCSECKEFISEILGDFRERPVKDAEGNDTADTEYLCGYCNRKLDEILMLMNEFEKEKANESKTPEGVQ